MKLVGPALEAAMKQASKQVKACLNCFVAGTLVATACGLVPIEEVQAGDWVWARDEVTGEVRLCEVEETYRNESPVILEVTVGNEMVATTPGHPFWVLEHGWKDAGELEVGDRLVNLRGESVVVEDIRRRPVPEAVYNFSVAGLHTYFVGQGGIWVHNASGPGCGVGGAAAKSGGTTSRAARREAMRLDGIPTSQQPVSQTKNASGREYEYETPKPGGGTQLRSVQQQTMDSSHHGQGHWEAGTVKIDPVTGEVMMNNYGRPKLRNDKSKMDYND
jgi:hypothetical protein